MPSMIPDESCIKWELAKGSLLFVVCFLSIVINVIISFMLNTSKISPVAAAGIRALCLVFIFNTGLLAARTSLSMFTCYLDNTVVCMVQAVVNRLGETAAHLIICMFYLERFLRVLEYRRNNQTARIFFVLFLIIWPFITCMSEMPLILSINYHMYLSILSCDIVDARVLVVSDSILYCIPGVLVLAISVGLLTSDVTRLGRRFSSHTIYRTTTTVTKDELQEVAQVAKPGVALATMMLLEWSLRVAGFLGTDLATSGSLKTLSMFLMLIRYVTFPSILFITMRGNVESLWPHSTLEMTTTTSM